MEFDREKALFHARLAEHAYRANAATVGQLEAMGMRDTIQVDHGHSQGYVGRIGDTVYVVIRGSDEPKDWIRNFKFVFKTRFRVGRNTECRVHRGFEEAYREIGGQMRSAFNSVSLKTRNLKTVVIGHSLGAAIAVLLSTRILEPDEVWLFGCPNVGNRAFAREYNFLLGHKTVNVRNGTDLVPLGPPWNYGVGRRFWLHRGEAVYFAGFFRRLAAQVVGLSRWFLHVAVRKLLRKPVLDRGSLPGFAKKHFVSSYREALDQ